MAILAVLIWKLAPLATRSAEPANRQTPSSLAIEGPTRIRPGSTTTYFVDLRYPEPLDAEATYRVRVEVAADAFGDRVLEEVRVVLRDGSAGGRATFSLSCQDPGNGDLVLRGPDGTSASDGVWQLYGRVPDQNTSKPFEGRAGLNVICGG